MESAAGPTVTGAPRVTGSGKAFTMASVLANVNRPALVLAHNNTWPRSSIRSSRASSPRTRSSTSSPITTTTSRKLRSRSPTPTSTRKRSSRPRSTHAAERDAQHVRAGPRRHHRGLRLLHLRAWARPSRTTDAPFRASGRLWTAATCSPSSSTPVRPQRLRPAPRTFRCAETSSRSCRLRGDRDPHRAVRRRGRVDHSFDPLTGKTLCRLAQVAIYPSSHYVTPAPKLHDALKTIEAELTSEKAKLEGQGKLLEAPRAVQRTMFDLEMLREVALPRHRELLAAPVGPPARGAAADLARLPAQYALRSSTSRISLSRRLRAMFHGDRHRKSTLVEFGFRLVPPRSTPAAQLRGGSSSASAGRVRLRHARALRAAARGGAVASRVIRPTGLTDPRSPYAGEGPGGRPPGRDPPSRGRQPACARHHADQADGGRPDRVTTRPVVRCNTCTPTSRPWSA